MGHMHGLCKKVVTARFVYLKPVCWPECIAVLTQRCRALVTQVALSAKGKLVHGKINTQCIEAGGFNTYAAQRFRWKSKHFSDVDIQ
jgi:hypothetical protein